MVHSDQTYSQSESLNDSLGVPPSSCSDLRLMFAPRGKNQGAGGERVPGKISSTLPQKSDSWLLRMTPVLGEKTLEPKLWREPH